MQMPTTRRVHLEEIAGWRPSKRKGVRIVRAAALAVAIATAADGAGFRTGRSVVFVSHASPYSSLLAGTQVPTSIARHEGFGIRPARMPATKRPSTVQAHAVSGAAAVAQRLWSGVTFSRVLGVVTLWTLFSLWSGRPKEVMDGDAMQEQWSKYARRPAARARSLMAGAARVGVLIVRAEFAKNKEKQSKLRRAAGSSAVKELLKLGPTYVKLGQIASCRSDILPEEYIDELKALQDEVPPFGPARAKRRLEEELGKKVEEVFESFDGKALASASLGQVHKARLLDGTDVAIKIQRGDLREMYDLDLAQFEKVIKILDRFKIGVSGASQNWMEIFDEAKVLLYREIDYRAEAENSERVRLNFEKEGTKVKWFKVPKVYLDLTTEQVLTMEFVQGTKITDNAALDALKGIDRVKLGARVAEAYLIMFCKHGFFNTDPHPGNLAVDREAPGGRIIMYDFGQACELSDSQCDGILQCIQSIVDLDAEACVKSFDKLGVLKPDADRKAVLAKVQNNFDTGKVRSKASKGPEADASIKADKEAKDAEKYFQFPSQLGFVFRALTQLQGVGTCLDDEWEFIESVAPKVPEVQMARGAGLDYLAGEFMKNLKGRKEPSRAKKR